MKIKYRIVSGKVRGVEETVANLLNAGWELNGGVSVTEHSMPNAINPEEKLLLIYAQSLVKKD